MTDTKHCKSDLCDKTPVVYVEMEKTRSGSTYWESGCFCRNDAQVFKRNLTEQGYVLHKEMTVQEYKDFLGIFDTDGF